VFFSLLRGLDLSGRLRLVYLERCKRIVLEKCVNSFKERC